LGIGEALKSIVTRAGVVRVRSVVNALLWALPLVMASCLVSAYFIGPNTWVIILFAALVMGTFLLFVFSFLYFLFKDPDRLQSEEYVLAQRELTILERKGEPPMVVDDRSRNDNRVIEMEAEPPDSTGDQS
jgi:hypothetical protein